MFLRILLIGSMLMIAFALGTVSWQLLGPAPAEAVLADTGPALAPPARLRILVSARALPAGTLVKDDDMVVREIAASTAPEAALAASDDIRSELRGALVRRFLDPGTVLERADILRPRDRGFLAAVLRPGSRAISVGVDVVTGTAGLIWPGDQVDLILTQELAAEDAPLGRRVIGETALSDVRVIAVDQQFTQGAGGEGLPTRIARTVTLEVTAEQAERVAVASRLGRLALSVRAIETSSNEAAAQPGRTLFGSDVSQALARSGLSQGTRMRVIQGEERAEVTFR
jgi:pilus assembly protein CpaB